MREDSCSQVPILCVRIPGLNSCQEQSTYLFLVIQIRNHGYVLTKVSQIFAAAAGASSSFSLKVLANTSIVVA